jgi:hypothetical protein
MSVNGTVRWRGLTTLSRRLWELVHDTFVGPPPVRVTSHAKSAPPAGNCEPLRRVLLTDGVARTLFEEYAEHRATEKGEEETGWLLLGLREKDDAVALATLPAGTMRDAGVAHVRFNSLGQAVGSRIVRQRDRRLTILGVVHTHPGSLRHPSEGDFEGDRLWVQNLRGGEGVFGIGNASEKGNANGTLYARQPRPNVQSLGELTFTWYSLRTGERKYRPLAVETTLGPDLARPLHEVWDAIEEHADALDRLYRQQAGLSCQVIDEGEGLVLSVNVALAERGDAIRVLLGPDGPRYLVGRGGNLFEVDPGAGRIDQGVYLLLAELAARS